MRYKQTVSRKRTLVVFAFIGIVLLTGIALGRSLVKTALLSAQTRQYKSKGHLLRKKVNLTKKAAASISIQLSGLQATDLVNIRPAEKTMIEATAGLNTGSLETGFEARPLEPSALEVTESVVSFTRPSSADGVVFLDIQIPSGAQAQVTTDGNTILTAVVREPVSIHGQEIGQGGSNITEAIAQSMMPHLSKKPEGVIYRGKDGKYFVSSSKLQVAKRVDLNIDRPVAVVLDIDEAGHIVNITSTTEPLSTGAMDALKQWEFVPFRQDGKAVAITTSMVLTPKSQ